MSKTKNICPNCKNMCDKDGWVSLSNISYVLKCKCEGKYKENKDE